MLNDIIKTTPEIDNKLEIFFELHKNSLINLTAIKEREEFYIKHYLDSIYYFEKYGRPHGALADIGSGGGFPGIVIAIFYPNIKVTLIESIGKKCKFLTDAVSELKLNNVEVLNVRAENVKNRSFDTITARGVSGVRQVLQDTWRLSKKGSRWLLYKGERLNDEIAEAEQFLKKMEVHLDTIRIEKPFTRSYCIINR